jgi:hypothetical protein
MQPSQQMKVIRANQEEVHLRGPEGPEDVRIIQSYPSKVSLFLFFLVASLSVR